VKKEGRKMTEVDRLGSSGKGVYGYFNEGDPGVLWCRVKLNLSQTEIADQVQAKTHHEKTQVFFCKGREG